jgi:hypothetical protein
MVELDCELSTSKVNSIADAVLDNMLVALEFSKGDKNISGWDIFLWLEKVFPKLTPLQKNRVQTFVAENYGSYTQDILVLEMAEWVGGFKNYWAVGTVRGWLYKKLSGSAFSHLSGAFRELLDDTGSSSSDSRFLNEVMQLKQEYESHVECAPRTLSDAE